MLVFFNANVFLNVISIFREGGRHMETFDILPTYPIKNMFACPFNLGVCPTPT